MNNFTAFGYNIQEVANMQEHKKISGKAAFFRAMLYTASAIALIIIGYFSAGYFFG